jgi:hypothetical protein
MLSASAIEAVEVYIGNQGPIQFQQDNRCGSIVVWTRR